MRLEATPPWKTGRMVTCGKDGHMWEVVGGESSGGIIVRTGKGLSSTLGGKKLSCGALVEECDMQGNRLHYRLLKGDGPDSGWVSIRNAGRDLLRRLLRIPPLPTVVPDVSPMFLSHPQAQDVEACHQEERIVACERHKQELASTFSQLDAISCLEAGDTQNRDDRQETEDRSHRTKLSPTADAPLRTCDGCNKNKLESACHPNSKPFICRQCAKVTKCEDGIGMVPQAAPNTEARILKTQASRIGEESYARLLCRVYLNLLYRSYGQKLAGATKQETGSYVHAQLPTSCPATPATSHCSVPRRYGQVLVVRTRRASGYSSAEFLSSVKVLSLRESPCKEGAQTPSVFVCPSEEVSMHPWLGFGGSFTEASAVVLKRMSKDHQEEVLRAYFSSPECGHGYTLGRLPIGSCDFSCESWTCGALAEDDFELKAFSISRYTRDMLPMLARASELAGVTLTLLASPWTPPPWMKTRKQFSGGGKLRRACRNTWALHFVRFVEEMERAGFPIWGVSVQNEAEAEQCWESCEYSAEEERDFVRDHLGPALERAGLQAIKILIWDHNRDGMLERASIAYSDPEAARYIWGVAYHWYGDARFETWPECSKVSFENSQRNSRGYELRSRTAFENVRRVAELRPDKHVIQTESCQELGGRSLESLDDWKVGERYAMNIIADMNAGCEGWIDWNLLLDERGGPNHAGNFCMAAIICDTKKGKVLYQPAYYYLGHFARYIRPGARRVVCGTSRDVLEVTAFKNLDRSVAIVVMNQSEVSCDFCLKVAGSGGLRTTALARSITTYVLIQE